jgi:hypothetical protein
MHAIGVPEGVTFLEFDGTNPEAPEVQQPEPEAQEVQRAAEVPGEVVVECSDHKPCNLRIIGLLNSKMPLSIMLYILLH